MTENRPDDNMSSWTMKIKALLLPLVTVLLASIFSPVFLYCRNAEEAGFKEVLPAILAFGAAGLCIFALFTLITHGNAGCGCMITVVFVLLLGNFTLIEKILIGLFPKLRYWHTLPLIVMLGLHIAFLIWRFVPKALSGDIVKVLSLIFGALLLINIVTAVPHIVNHAQTQRQLRESRSASAVQTDSNKPNIYLFLFDEYANFPQMKEYYGYDNAPLQKLLDENGFSVSYTGHNESIFTATVTTNLANLEYVVEDKTPGSDKELLRKQGALFSLMEEHGYTVQGVESPVIFGLDSVLGNAGASNAASASGENLFQMAVKQTVFYPIIKLNTADSLNGIMRVVNYMSEPESLPDGGTFTLVYLCLPHHPFIVDENGGPVPASQAINWKDTQYYLGQYKFATKVMIKMVENILENDADSVIFLQSDHGARAYGIPDVTFPIEYMSNPLNAVYYRGEAAPEIEGLSTVNAIRTVLNRLWGIDLEMQDVPDAVA